MPRIVIGSIQEFLFHYRNQLVLQELSTSIRWSNLTRKKYFSEPLIQFFVNENALPIMRFLEQSPVK